MKRLLKELGIDLDSPRPLGTNRIRALKVENPPYQDLCIDLWTLDDGTVRFAVAHYGKQNGDLMADPDMEFEYRDGKLRALSFQNDYVGVYDEAPENEAERLEFARIWEKNLILQGFTEAKK